MFDFKAFDGGRTRARTLDPLIKRNRVMLAAMEARAAQADVTAQGGRESVNRKATAFYRGYLIDDRSWTSLRVDDDRR
jgi:hypothetical protein